MKDNRKIRNRKTGKAFGRIWVCAAALLLTLGCPAGLFRAHVVLASDGAQTEAAGRAETDTRTETDAWPETGVQTETGAQTETGEAGEKAFTELLSEEQRELLEELLEKLEDGELSTREQIDEAISRAQEELGITLSGEQKEQIAGLALQADRLGLDREAILNGAQALYEKYGSAALERADDAIRENIVEPVKEAAAAEVKKTFRDFFHDMGETVKNFVLELIG